MASTADLTSAPAASTARVVLGVLFVVYFFSSIDRSVFGILAQPIKEDLSLADWELGLLSGFAFAAINMAFGFPMARLTDKANRVNILTVCILLWSVMTALCGLSANFVQLVLYRMGVGIGEAGCLPASHSLISDFFPPNARTKALAIYGLGFPAGGLLGTIAAGVILDHWGWRAAFYIVGLPGLLIALVTWLLIREPARGRLDGGGASDPGFADPRSFVEIGLLLWRNKVLRQMLLALTTMSLMAGPTATFLSPYLKRRFPDMSYTEVGFIVGTGMMLGASLSTYFGSLIAQRLGRRNQRWLMWFPGIGIAVGAVFYVTALAQNSWQGLAAWMFFGALINATYLAPSFTVLYNIVPPGGRAKAAVITGLLMGLIGQSLGALLSGVANDFVAARLFGNYAPQGFMAACPGGHAAKGASAALDAMCRGSVVDATQIVLIATMTMTVWPAIHYYFAGRNMEPVGTDRA